jgi:hypothetical protein
VAESGHFGANESAWLACDCVLATQSKAKNLSAGCVYQKANDWRFSASAQLSTGRLPIINPPNFLEAVSG